MSQASRYWQNQDSKARDAQQCSDKAAEQMLGAKKAVQCDVHEVATELMQGRETKVFDTARVQWIVKPNFQGASMDVKVTKLDDQTMSMSIPVAVEKLGRGILSFTYSYWPNTFVSIHTTTDATFELLESM